jgi:WD repeat and SOF domain-containing protein 1
MWQESRADWTALPMCRIFAKPFVAAMEGHTDGVYCLGKDPRRTDVVAGGGGDGGTSYLPSKEPRRGKLTRGPARLLAEIILHSLPHRRPLVRIPNAHRGQVNGLCFSA